MVNCSAAEEKDMAGPSCSKDVWGEKVSSAFIAFVLPRKDIPAEWDKSSLLGENICDKTTIVNLIYAPNKNSEFLLLLTLTNSNA